MLFTVYINETLLSIPFMYADDVTLVEPVEDPVVSTMSLNSDLSTIASWANQWLLHFNAAKCKSNVSWTTHIKQISDTVRRRLGMIRYVSHKLP